MKRVFLGALIVIALLIAGVAWVVQSAWLRGLLERQVETMTGREVSIGRLDIDIRSCLRIEADELRIANPDWAETENLIDAGHLRACIAWLPLLIGRAHIKSLELADAKLGLERDRELATWAIGKEQKEDKGEAPPVINNVRVSNTLIRFRDTEQRIELDMRAEGGTEANPNVTLRATGKVRNADIEAVLNSPAALPSPDAPVVVSAAFTLANTTAAAAGRLTSLGVDGIEMLLTIAGDDLSDLNRLDIELPESPPYALRGRLRNAHNTWSLEPFEGRVGDSDLSGSLTYEIKQPRALLTADASSKLLDFDDLGPLVGAPPRTGHGERASPKQKKQAQAIKNATKVLPDKPLAKESWKRLDADVRYRAEQVKRPDAVPINALATHLRIENATLRLQPLNFEVAGGKVVSNIVLDATMQPPQAAADFNVRQIHLAKLFPKITSQNVAAGTLFGRAKLKARGNSIAKLLGSADGDLTLMVNGGQMSAILLEAAGLDIAEVVKFLTIRDKPVPLRCAIADLHIDQGLAKTELFVIDTQDTVFIGDGRIDMAKEHLDITIHPRPKDQSILALRSPLHIEGSFKEPSAGVKPGPLAAKSAAAVALGLVNPLLAIVPLIETGPGENSDCGEFSRRVRQSPQKNASASNEKEKKRAAGEEKN